MDATSVAAAKERRRNNDKGQETHQRPDHDQTDDDGAPHGNQR